MAGAGRKDKQMKHPSQWRETCDPFSLPYHTFQPTRILGYPHAGNDVFHARGIYQDKEVTVYIKAARQAGAAIDNEVNILSQLSDPSFPTIIDCGFEDIPFSVTLELPGERLSTIVGDNEKMDSLSYLTEYGAALAKLHQMKLRAKAVADRRFFHAPSNEMLKRSGLEQLGDFFANPPAEPVKCFCHGDFHYANVLWKERHISGVLDFELAGYGNRDFDIAWALFLRPGQKFLKTQTEHQAFLKGYAQHGIYDSNAVRYYMAQCYVYFLQSCSGDKSYADYIRTWLSQIDQK